MKKSILLAIVPLLFCAFNLNAQNYTEDSWNNVLKTVAEAKDDNFEAIRKSHRIVYVSATGPGAAYIMPDLPTFNKNIASKEFNYSYKTGRQVLVDRIRGNSYGSYKVTEKEDEVVEIKTTVLGASILNAKGDLTPELKAKFIKLIEINKAAGVNIEEVLTKLAADIKPQAQETANANSAALRFVRAHSAPAPSKPVGANSVSAYDKAVASYMDAMKAKEDAYVRAQSKADNYQKALASYNDALSPKADFYKANSKKGAPRVSAYAKGMSDYKKALDAKSASYRKKSIENCGC